MAEDDFSLLRQYLHGMSEEPETRHDGADTLGHFPHTDSGMEYDPLVGPSQQHPDTVVDDDSQAGPSQQHPGTVIDDIEMYAPTGSELTEFSSDDASPSASSHHSSDDSSDIGSNIIVSPQVNRHPQEEEEQQQQQQQQQHHDTNMEEMLSMGACIQSQTLGQEAMVVALLPLPTTIMTASPPNPKTRMTAPTLGVGMSVRALMNLLLFVRRDREGTGEVLRSDTSSTGCRCVIAATICLRSLKFYCGRRAFQADLEYFASGDGRERLTIKWVVWLHRMHT